MEEVDVVVIGGGQAGLATSYYLSQTGREHIVLEQAAIGETWRAQRWDSFALVTPNWMLNLPGFPYTGDDPHGFLTRAEIQAHLRQYAASFGAPVRTGCRVNAVRRHGDDRFLVATSSNALSANQVVVATGAYATPRLPLPDGALDPGITQLTSSDYRNPESLPPGNALIIGSGQSGAQIAEEIQASGRQVYLSLGRCGSLPRRYRGRDIFEWFAQAGIWERTHDMVPMPRTRISCNPLLSGKDGGRDLNLHTLDSIGVQFVGRLRAVESGRIEFHDDREDSQAQGQAFAANLLKRVDEHIERHAPETPTGEPPPTYAFQQPALTELDLRREQIQTVIWATGFRYDFEWIEFPVVDETGYPLQERGVTSVPGLYFVGIHWLHKMKSALLYGVGDDAAYIVDHLAQQR